MRFLLRIDDDSFTNQDPSEGDIWLAPFFIGRGTRSVMMSYPAFWADEAATSARVPIVPLSFGGVAPDDSGATQALATMQSCFDVDLVVTARRLIEVRKHYYIPSEYELHVPLPGQHPYDAFSSGFSLSTNTLEVG
ncbi:hypothetical protein GW17_00055007 [Ensete ventricosum]|nr:hypothetical protein GW17_00055007 [Ensete ventricosum]